MLKKVFIIVGIIVTVLLCFGVCLYFINITESKADEKILNNNESISKDLEENASIISGDSVIIKNGLVQNEYLIDDFISKAVETNSNEEKLKIYLEKDFIEVVYVPGEYAISLKSGDETKAKELKNELNQDYTWSKARQVNGGYDMYKNGKLVHSYFINGFNGFIIKKETRYNQVRVYFYSELIDLAEFPIICKYSLENVDYTYDLYINFIEDKDAGLKDIYTNRYQSIKTYGGNVEIILDGNRTFDLQKGLENQEFTINDILNECSSDFLWDFKERGFSEYSEVRNSVNEENRGKDDFYEKYIYKDYTVIYVVDGTNHTLIIGNDDSVYDTYIKNR